MKKAHDLYKTGDKDAPDRIKDNNGEVVLSLCKRCGKAEAELDEWYCIDDKKMKKAHDILREAAQTYEERNKVYGDNYIRVGAVMEAHFPNGLFIRTADDWKRLHIFLLGVVKDTRYVTNWDAGGHADSSRDRTVYSAMLEEIDTEINERPELAEPFIINELQDFARNIRDRMSSISNEKIKAKPVLAIYDECVEEELNDRKEDLMISDGENFYRKED